MTTGSVEPSLSLAIRTLIAGGFELEQVTKRPGFSLLVLHRFDEFGAVHRYVLALAQDRALSANEVDASRISADHHSAQLVVIGETNADVPKLKWEKFLNLFGGAVNSLTVLEESFASDLDTLGRNELPPGMVGAADDLFEIHVRAALQFILAGRVTRYGQERRFEARPDGIALPSKNFHALYDAKAYSDGYPVTADSIRQFASYTREFTERYEPYLDRLHSFIVVSADFDQGDAALANRSQEFIAQTGVPLSFIRTAVLGETVTRLAEQPSVRRSINWARVFSAPIVSISQIINEMTAIRKDAVIRSP